MEYYDKEPPTAEANIDFRVISERENFTDTSTVG